MRGRVTLSIALVSLCACSLLTDLDGFSGGPTSTPDGGDAGPTKSSSSSSSGDATTTGDAAVDAPSGVGDGSVDANPAACTEQVLVGSNLLAPQYDSIDPNAIDAYGYKAVQTGTGNCIWIYLAAIPSSSVVLAVYGTSDSGSMPSKLLAEGSIEQPVLGWNAVRASAPIEVTAGVTMWIGVSALESGTQVREYENVGCGALYLRSGASTGTTHAPNPFPASAVEFPKFCNMAAYVSP